MKKFFLVCSLLIASNFCETIQASFSLNNPTAQKLRIPQGVLRTAELWACDNGVLPETPLPDYVRAFYTKMSKSTWEVHWVWSKGGVAGEARLLITNGGELLNVY